MLSISGCRERNVRTNFCRTLDPAGRPSMLFRTAVRMGQRFVFMPNQPGKRAEKVFRADNDLVVIGLVSGCDQARVFEFVRLALFEGNAKCLYWLAHLAAHHR